MVELEEIANRLRSRLIEDPPRMPFDDHAEAVLDRFLSTAARAERALLPPPHAAGARADGAPDLRLGAGRRAIGRSIRSAVRWRALRRLAIDDESVERPDDYLVAQAWLDLVAPALEAERAARRLARYVLLRYADARLRATALALGDVEEAMSRLPIAAPLDQRISACILGVPAP